MLIKNMLNKESINIITLQRWALVLSHLVGHLDSRLHFFLIGLVKLYCVKFEVKFHSVLSTLNYLKLTNEIYKLCT